MPLFNQRATSPTPSDDDLIYVPPPKSGQRITASTPTSAASTITDDRLLTDLLTRTTPIAPSQRRIRRPAQTLRQTQASITKPPVSGRPLAPPVVVTVYGLAWWQRMALELMSYLFAWVLWGINAIFTILGLISVILPATTIGIILGMLIHLFISWGEQYYPRQQGGIKILGWFMGFCDISTNVYGLAASIAFLRPELLAGLPSNPVEWFAPFMGSFVSGLGLTTEPTPKWILQAILLIFLAAIVALTPEFLVKYFRARVYAVWNQRHVSGDL